MLCIGILDTPWRCTEDEFQCDSGQCISRDLVCVSGKKQEKVGCADGSHLLKCSKFLLD